jgi:enoyl-CoA hydratase/carnithine racemase
VTDPAAVRVERRDDAYVVWLDHDQNLFDDAFLPACHAAFDEIEADLTDATAARPVVTSGTGKFFSNGFDLDYLGRLGGAADDGAGLLGFVDASCRLLARVLTFPAPTVAAVNGHAFGIGAMFALAHDQQVMRADRGWFCLPEVDYGLPFQPFMQALVTTRLPPRTAQEAMLTGRRYDGATALATGIVDATAPGEQLVGHAIERAAAWAGKQPKVIGALKAQLHAAVTAALPA